MAEQYQTMSNQIAENAIGKADIVPTTKERERLRSLAKEYAEIAQSDLMKERKAGWKAVRDLKPVRPMILFETLTVAGFVRSDEFECQNEYLRNAEHSFVEALKHYRTVGDDIVFEPWFQLAWQTHKSDWGVQIVEHHAEDSMAYLSNFPIKDPSDLSKLKKRTFSVDRERTLGFKETLEDIFGDILPVRVGNVDKFFSDMGFNPFCGNNAPLLTMDVFKMMGYEAMSFWSYENEAALRQLQEFLLDDNLRYMEWLEAEGLLTLNTDNQFAGPSGYGYVSELPEADGKPAKLSDCWTWCESQETSIFSPQMYADLFLPYLAAYCNRFGLVSYGCCEPVDDRIEFIKKAIPKLRTVSISGWNNFEKVAEALGKDYVYCCKPKPSYISAKMPDWDEAREAITRTWNAAKNQPLEFVVRDVYDLDDDLSRISRWVEMTKQVVGIG